MLVGVASSLLLLVLPSNSRKNASTSLSTSGDSLESVVLRLRCEPDDDVSEELGQVELADVKPRRSRASTDDASR